jgi:hypothetical protein
MGNLFYGNESEPITIPDRVLAHLKVVISTKLRRQEAFTISWRHSDDEAPGRSTLWMHPAIPIRFTFESAEAEVLDPELLQRLANEAARSGGLTVDLGMFDTFPVLERQRERELVLAATA